MEYNIKFQFKNSGCMPLSPFWGNSALYGEIFQKNLVSILAQNLNPVYLCPAFEKRAVLAHGVTVAQQILVLFVRVRILVDQPP